MAASMQNSENIRKRGTEDAGIPCLYKYDVHQRSPLPQKHKVPFPVLYESPKYIRNGINGKHDSNFTTIKTKIPAESELGGSSTRSFIILGFIFLGAIVALGTAYLNFPKLQEEEKEHIKLPRNIDDAKRLGQVLSQYKDLYFVQVLGGYFLTYIFLQTFAIPGSIFLSILSGFLFHFPVALFLVCLCSAVGASFCYLLSYLVGRRLVWKYIPARVSEWSSHVQRHRDHLFNYILFLRITPFLPNWFINITSPVISVPLMPFFWGTFFGVLPPSFVAIQAGQTLQQLTSSSDAVSWFSMAVLAGLAVLSLLPVVFQKYLKKKFD